MNFGVIKYITYIVIIIGLIVGRLKEITQQYIKTINEYIDGFITFRKQTTVNPKR